MWLQVRPSVICLDPISYCEGHFQCLLKQHAYNLSISPLALKCANDILCTRFHTLSPLAKVWMVISLLALTCDFTVPRSLTHINIIGTHTIGLCDLWPLSLLHCHGTCIDFFSSLPSSLLLPLPPNVSLLLSPSSWRVSHSPPPSFVWLSHLFPPSPMSHLLYCLFLFIFHQDGSISGFIKEVNEFLCEFVSVPVLCVNVFMLCACSC